MGTITEVNNYDATVNEIENGADVVGGSGGALNLAAQSLANRTKYLKAQIDALNADWETLQAAAFLDVGTTTGTVAAGNHAHAVATETTNGFMSATDKTALDALAPSSMQAENYNFSGPTTTVTIDAGTKSMLIVTCDIVNGANDTLGLKVEANGTIVYNKQTSCNFMLGWSPAVFLPDMSGEVVLKLTTIGGGTGLVGNTFSVAVLGTP